MAKRDADSDSVRINILTWNVMGDTGEGWAAARKEFIKSNIEGYDMVFLQEVQWVDEKNFTPADTKYWHIMTKSEGKQRNVFILYDPEKLELRKKKKAGVTETVESVPGWTDEDSQRVCIGVFKLKGKDKASKFAAIGVHAPRDARASNDRPGECRKNERFCRLLKAGVDKISEDHRLPVLMAGDFNSDIRHWNSYRFLVPEYDTDRNPIDFTALKITKDNHLKIAQVEETKYLRIKHPPRTNKLEVKEDGSKTVAKLLQEHGENLYPFFKYLCGGHKPLSAAVTYSEAIVPVSGIVLGEDVARLEAKVEELEGEVATLKDDNSKLHKKIDALQKAMEELKEK